jgi:hypothetical protein
VLVFDLPIKGEKTEHVVLGTPLGLSIRRLRCSNLILCIYADPRRECYFCAVAVVPILFLVDYLLCSCPKLYLFVNDTQQDAKIDFHVT